MISLWCALTAAITMVIRGQGYVPMVFRIEGDDGVEAVSFGDWEEVAGVRFSFNVPTLG